MKFQNIILIVSGYLIFGCATPKSKASPEQMRQLKEVINERHFEIESDWALPLTTNALVSLQNAGLFPPGSNANQINLIGNPNYFKVKNDSVFAYLPYYGEVQMSAGHYGNDDGAIVIKNTIDDLEIERKKNGYQLKFRTIAKNEGYRIFLNLFTNGRTSLRLNGNNRFPIEYTGRFSALELKEKSSL